jgi:hypothetical protein
MARLKFEIAPLQGVGPILFRMPREKVRKTLQSIGADFDAFQKSEQLKYKTDAFDSMGLHVYYTGKKPLVNFVEVFSGDGVAHLYRGKKRVRDGYPKIAGSFLDRCDMRGQWRAELFVHVSRN